MKTVPLFRYSSLSLNAKENDAVQIDVTAY